MAFWNLVGAGLFGFLINPPIALYYMQGLNTTPVHGHTALFGVYGMLGIGLMLFCLRGPDARQAAGRRGALAFAFWAINIGLALMVLLEPAAGRPAADLGQRRARHVVRPLGRVHADRRCMDNLRWLRVDRRHDLRRRRRWPWAGSSLGLKTGWSLERGAAPAAALRRSEG